MNFRSLTRGDGAVIAAAVLLFIASFLDTFDCEGSDSACRDVPNAWENGPILMGVYLLGIIAAALIAVGRAQQTPAKVLGLDLGQVGVSFAVASALSAVFSVFDPGGAVDGLDAGVGIIIGTIAALALGVFAVITPLVPALKAPLAGAPGQGGPQAGAPYGGQPQGGYGYPGAQQQGQQPYGGQPQQAQQPYGSQGGQPMGQQAAPQQAQSADASQGGEFSPFWFAVPVPRPLYGEDGNPTPIAELAPGTWYLAVEQRGPGLVAQTQDGRRGVLQDTTGIQRG